MLIDPLCKLLWFFIDKFEKIYWFVVRREQRSHFLRCGKNVHIGRRCDFKPSILEVGDDVYIGTGCLMHSTTSKIVIGNHVMFGPGVHIHSGNHRIDLVGKYMKSISFEDKKNSDDLDVVISDDVWIGANAIILNGVTIGEGSIIGAGAVVTKSIPPYSIYSGVSASKTRPRFNDDTIKLHKELLQR